MTIAWSRSALARSGSGISAIFTSRSRSPSALSCRARFRLQLLGALLHRRSFRVRESLGLLVGRGALGGLLRALLRGFLSAIAKHLRGRAHRVSMSRAHREIVPRQVRARAAWPCRTSAWISGTRRLRLRPRPTSRTTASCPSRRPVTSARPTSSTTLLRLDLPLSAGVDDLHLTGDLLGQAGPVSRRSSGAPTSALFA